MEEAEPYNQYDILQKPGEEGGVRSMRETHTSVTNVIHDLFLNLT